MKRIRTRTKSINLPKHSNTIPTTPTKEVLTYMNTPDKKLLLQNQNSDNTSNTSNISGSTIGSKYLHLQNTSTSSNSSNFFNNNSSNSNNYIIPGQSTPNTTTAKYNKYKETLSKKKTPKQISLNIASIQSPEHKAVYYMYNDTEISDRNVEKFSVGKIRSTKNTCNPILSKISEENIDGQGNELSLAPNSAPSKSSSNYKINFLLDQFGQEKVNKLINLIETSPDPMALLNGDGREIEAIVGSKFKLAQNFLKIFFVSSNECFIGGK